MKHGIKLSRTCAILLIALLAIFSVATCAWAAEGETTIIGLVPGEVGGFDGMPSVGGDTGGDTGGSSSNAGSGAYATGDNSPGNSSSSSSSGYGYSALVGSDSVYYSTESSAGGSAVAMTEEEAAAKQQSTSKVSVLSAGLPLAYSLQNLNDENLLSYLASQGVSYNTTLQALAALGTHGSEATVCVALLGLCIPGISLTELILIIALAVAIVIALIFFIRSRRLKRDLAGRHIAHAAHSGAAVQQLTQSPDYPQRAHQHVAHSSQEETQNKQGKSMPLYELRSTLNKVPSL